MQAETRTMTQLLQLDVRYVIPLYQRPYVWTEEQQWAPLWEDIVTVAEHFRAEGAGSKPPSHFLGAIVTQQQDNPPGTPQRFLVIDGQPRLTTLQILVGAAARVAQKLGRGGAAADGSATSSTAASSATARQSSRCARTSGTSKRRSTRMARCAWMAVRTRASPPPRARSVGVRSPGGSTGRCGVRRDWSRCTRSAVATSPSAAA